ncbi:DUF4347 domain-containing protein [Shewanella eurypsychrophilus]|uniref:DUF4347 domain-containing protein n=1 Tax=Shewanella eurypsychrophilus TaxID=2593656 RepID=A0ABX6VAT6_9GAMM|nr:MULTISPECIES: DUF4347 domain-containing protein [Shewanella]QFU24367.1 DUF4347 domain-containing protein [Shewanella sp. YLB-09]QPG59567.1 DUF4347 domain-containing protein [Shewanella eurypsychrophilus]
MKSLLSQWFRCISSLIHLKVVNVVRVIFADTRKILTQSPPQDTHGIGLFTCTFLIATCFFYSQPLLAVDDSKHAKHEYLERDLIIIDLAVHDPQMLVAALDTKAKQQRGIISYPKVVFLQPSLEPLQQILTAVEQTGRVSSISIISHASTSALLLAGRWVDKYYIIEKAPLMREVSTYFNQGTELSLYGCNLTSGRLEKHFVDTLADLTSLNVSRAVDINGELSEGRAWKLEYQIRDIELASKASRGLNQAVHQP